MRSYFEGLLGNADTKARIAVAIENGRLPHALLIGGPSGSGKSTYALEIAAAINCRCKSDKSRPLPCRECNNCRRIYDNSFPDVKTLSKPADKTTLGVDAVKDFREDMFLSSTESDHKIYIIDDAEAMTAEAQNALLKILEEPPLAVTIILLARECDRILTTIKSRVQYIPMSRFSEDELTRHTLSISPEAKATYAADPERFKSIIMSADGRLGYAKTLFDPRLSEENAEQREEVMKVIDALCGRTKYSDIYLAINSLPTKRNELSDAFERLFLAFRDLVAVKYSDDVRLLFFTSRETAKEYAKDISAKRLLSMYDELKHAHELCAKNCNLQNLIASLAANLKIKSNC